jgi:hypothetical protein
MLRCVIGVEVIDVSKDRTASIFRDISYFAKNFRDFHRGICGDQCLLTTGVVSLGLCSPTFRNNAVEGTT